MLGGLRTRLQPIDLWLAVGFVLAAAVEAVIRYRGQPALLAQNLSGSVTFSCLALRRIRPLLTMSILTVAFCASSIAQALQSSRHSSDAIVPIFALLFVSFSLGVFASRRQLLWAAWQPSLIVVVVDTSEPGKQSLAGAALFIAIFISAAPILAGRLVRGRTSAVRRLRRQAVEIAGQREMQIEAAVTAERLQTAQRFNETLALGLDAIASKLVAVAAPGSENHIGDVENAARELLSATREEVVALTTPAPHAQAQEEPRASEPDLRDAAQRWTVLLGGALAVGLLAETRSLSLHVPVPVAWLGCVAVAIPLALTWLGPLMATCALWTLVGLFDRLVAPLASSFTAVGLAFVPAFLVAALESRRSATAGLIVCGLAEAICIVPSASNVAVVLCCWLAGAIVHERARLAEQLRVNNALLAAQRAAAQQRAVNQERLRMARDLHDAIGHSLTVITLQAGAARRIARADPVRAQEVLRTIAAVAHDGLAELRRGADHQSGNEMSFELSDLVARARGAGMHVDANLGDVVSRLTPDARLTIYRVVQEALTNALKHAPGAAVTLSLQFNGEHVELTISNDPPAGGPSSAPGGGQGLRSMRARVEACGGCLRWEPGQEGSFVVHAELPTALVRS